MNKEFWNERYGQHLTVYGDGPNEFFKEQLQSLTPGKLLLPAEGEGRNAIYAASLGWKVTAYDFSEVAKTKTLDRAASLGITTIDYKVEDITKIKLPDAEYDAVGLIYIHLPTEVRKHLHQQCKQSLKPGGKLLFESFSKAQLKYNTGGPNDPALLHSILDLREAFTGLQIDLLEELIIELKEGSFHSGPASVVRLIASRI